MPSQLPKEGYRPCVGIMLLNSQGLAWIGRRHEKVNDDGVGYWWQMPQGGIDEGEEPRETALRELREETGIVSAHIIAESPSWYEYDLPKELIGKSWGGRWRGQTQKWFAARFTGDENEINLAPPGHKQEFDQWRWASMNEVIDLIVPFKRDVYRRVVSDFQRLVT